MLSHCLSRTAQRQPVKPPPCPAFPAASPSLPRGIGRVTPPYKAEWFGRHLVRSMHSLRVSAATITALVWTAWPILWSINPATAPNTAVGWPIVSISCGVALGSLLFLRRPTKWLSVPVFVLSLLMAALFVFVVSQHARWCLYQSAGYYSWAGREMIVMGWPSLFLAVLFIAVTSIWAVICVRSQRDPSRT
jgi:hypothetical protein